MSQPNTTVVAAKRRERGLSVIEQRRRDEEAELLRATVKRKVAAKNGKRVSRKLMQATGGKAMKTGMLLARARLTSATGGVIAAHQRQNSLLAKGTFRDAERLAREGPVGSLSVSEMPRRKDATTDAAAAKHAGCFRSWMKRALKAKVCWHGYRLALCVHARVRL